MNFKSGNTVSSIAIVSLTPFTFKITLSPIANPVPVIVTGDPATTAIPGKTIFATLEMAELNLIPAKVIYEGLYPVAVE